MRGLCLLRVCREEYQQTNGLDIGSPLSTVPACLFTVTTSYGSLYIKPTNKDVSIHYSNHSNEIKFEVAFGFLLRSLRICSPEFIRDEVPYDSNSFMEHKYSRGFMLNLPDRCRTYLRDQSPHPLLVFTYYRHAIFPRRSTNW